MANSAIVNTSGEENVEHDYSHKLADDCLSDKVMAEISRRLQSNIAFNDGGQVVYAPDPPNAKERLWVETNSTGSIIGTVKRYNTATSEWVDDHYHPEEESEEAVAGTILQRKLIVYNPSAFQALGNDMILIEGSTADFKPITLSSRITYEFNFTFYTTSPDSHPAVISMEMYLNDIIQPLSQRTAGTGSLYGSYVSDTCPFKHTIDSWGPNAGTMYLTGRAFGLGSTASAHTVYWWDGTGSNSLLTQANLIVTETKS